MTDTKREELTRHHNNDAERVVIAAKTHVFSVCLNESDKDNQTVRDKKRAAEKKLTAVT